MHAHTGVGGTPGAELHTASTPDYPIAALATPYMQSALAVIRVSGAGCLDLLRSIVRAPEYINDPARLVPRRATYCALVDKNNTIIDYCMLTCFASPRSYTGEDAAELCIHGSTIGIDRVLSLLRECGFADAEPGEFTKRAFLRGKMDLTQAEAVHHIITAHSAQEHERAAYLLSGALTRAIDDIKHKIVHIAATCRISLDYPDDEIQESAVIDPQTIDAVIHPLRELLRTYDFHTLQRGGARVVLGGKPNAGKSSLFNALVKTERSLVSEISGTTRDYLEHNIVMRGISVQLVDTAGLRDDSEIGTSKNAHEIKNQSVEHHYLESKGVEKSYTLLAAAKAILYVIDSAAGWTNEDTSIIQNLRERNDTVPYIIVWNKNDLEPDYRRAAHLPDHMPAWMRELSQVRVSALGYTGITELQDTLFALLTHGMTIPAPTDPGISSARQQQHAQACLDAMLHVQLGLKTGAPVDMISLDVDAALRELGAITGEVTGDDILDIMFSEFCVGK